MSTDVGTTDAGDYGARLRRRWWLVALGILFGLAAAALYTSTQVKTYTSTASVLVTGTGASTASVDNSRTSSESINLDTEAQLVKSAQVANAVRTKLAVQTPVSQLQKQVVVTVPPNSAILSIAYEGGTARAAQQGAHQFAQSYLDNRLADATAQIQARVASVQTQLKAAQDALTAASARSAATVDNSPERVLADAQRTVVINQVNDLTSQLSALQSVAVGGGSIITDSQLPSKASSPVPALNLGAGLAAGLLIGLATAVISDRADHRLRRVSDVTRQVGLPVLAEVPGPGRTPGRLPGDEHAAVFDRLRNTLVGNERQVHVLQVADVGERGATGVVALQLARSLVRTQREAVLVLAHPDSTLPQALGLAAGPGLVELLYGECTLEQAAQRVAGLPGVLVLARGGDEGELESVLQSPDLQPLLAGLRADAPLVVETLGTGDSAGAQAVAASSDVLLLVAERGRADSREIVRAADGAQGMGRDASGVVLVPPAARGTQRPDRTGDHDRGQGDRAQGDRAQGDRAQGDRAERGQGERAQGLLSPAPATGSTRLPASPVRFEAAPAEQPPSR